MTKMLLSTYHVFHDKPYELFLEKNSLKTFLTVYNNNKASQSTFGIRLDNINVKESCCLKQSVFMLQVHNA